MKNKVLEILKANTELISGDNYTNENFIHSSHFNYIAEKLVKLFAIPDVNCRLCERGISQKMLDAEILVINYIKQYHKPPTYRYVAKYFNIHVCAAYARLRYSRKLMVKRN